MPESRTQGAKPKPKTPSSPTPNAGGALDLSAYRQGGPTVAPPKGGQPRDPKNSTEQAAREMRDKVEWSALAGVPDLRIVDAWEDDDETYGPYTGTVVRLPKTGAAPSRDVLCLTSANTKAGARLTAAHARGLFDMLDGEGASYVPVTVGAKKSRMYPDGRPQVLLHFGDLVQG